MKLKPNDILEVTWTDCFGSAGWEKKLELPQPPEIHSVGFFIARSNKGIYMASGIEPTTDKFGDMLAPFWIPNGVIKKIRKLR